MNSHVSKMLVGLKESGVKVYAAAAGAGAEIQSTLWSLPGASTYLAGASFPYSKEAFVEFVGYEPEHFVSRDAAIGLAIASYVKASTSCGKSGDRLRVEFAAGLGVTAAVTTDRERRGSKRTEAVVVMADKAWAVSREISDCSPNLTPMEARMVDDKAHVSAIGFNLLCHAVLGSEGYKVEDITQAAREHLFHRPIFTRFGGRARPRVWDEGTDSLEMYPGNFNPPHDGHFAVSNEQTLFQVTANPPHKPQLSLGDMLQRVLDLKGKRDVMFLPGAPLYIDKARLFPNTTFVLGADALDRMLDPKWGPPVLDMLREFLSLGTRFKVAPRGSDTLRSVLARHPETHHLLATRVLFESLEPTQYKDLSSTQIREQR